MQCIAVGNLKGGTGKTTLAINIASEFSARGQKTMLYDADPQGSAAQWASMQGIAVQCIHLPLTDDATHIDVERWLRTVKGTKTDIVLIDLPPIIGRSTEAALFVCQLFLCPVKASGLDLSATQKAVNLVHDAQELQGDGLPKCVMVPSMVDVRTAAGKELPEVLTRFGGLVSPSVGYRVAFADAYTTGQWVGNYAKNSKAHADIVTLVDFLERKEYE